MHHLHVSRLACCVFRRRLSRAWGSASILFPPEVHIYIPRTRERAAAGHGGRAGRAPAVDHERRHHAEAAADDEAAREHAQADHAVAAGVGIDCVDLPNMASPRYSGARGRASCCWCSVAASCSSPAPRVARRRAGERVRSVRVVNATCLLRQVVKRFLGWPICGKSGGEVAPLPRRTAGEDGAARRLRAGRDALLHRR